MKHVVKFKGKHLRGNVSFSRVSDHELQVCNSAEKNITLHMFSCEFNCMNTTWNCLQDSHANNHIGHDNSEFLLTHTVKVECQTTLIVNTLAWRVSLFCKPPKSRSEMWSFVYTAWLLPFVIRSQLIKSCGVVVRYISLIFFTYAIYPIFTQCVERDNNFPTLKLTFQTMFYDLLVISTQ